MIAWVDVETSDLDAQTAHLLEVAIVLTDDQLVELAATHVVIEPATCSIVGLIAQMPSEVRAMHTANGLLEELRDGYCMRLDAAALVLRNWALPWLERIGLGEPSARNSAGRSTFNVPLAGSTVGFDRRWLQRHLPTFEELFSFRSIDVSSVTELAKRWSPSVYEVRPKGTVAHRALADVRESIAYLRYYRDAGFIGHFLSMPGLDRVMDDAAIEAIQADASRRAAHIMLRGDHRGLCSSQDIVAAPMRSTARTCDCGFEKLLEYDRYLKRVEGNCIECGAASGTEHGPDCNGSNR